MLWLLGVGKWLREAAMGLFNAARRYPMQAALIVALCLAGWFWWADQRHTAQRDAAIAGRTADRAAYDKASADNAAAQIAQNKATEAKSAAIAGNNENDRRTNQITAIDATARFAGANRLRPDQIRRLSSDSAAKGNDPGVPASLPPGAGMVAVSEASLQTCSADYTYALGAHNLAMDKIAAGLAKAD